MLLHSPQGNLSGKESTISHTNANTRFVVVLLFQETLGVFSLDDDLRNGVVVHTECHHMTVGPLVVGEGIGRGNIGVVIVVTAKEVELLVASVFHWMHDVVGNLATIGDGGLTDQGARIGRETLVVLVLVPRRDEVGIAEVRLPTTSCIQ